MWNQDGRKHRHIVSPERLAKQLDNPKLWIADCRFVLGQPEAGYKAYQAGHIPGAHYLDLEKDLSSPVTTHGGRHPLPSIEELEQTFQQQGLAHDMQVVLYDDQNSAMAARAWWLLKYMGHKEVYVLDSGYTGWTNAGYPITAEIPHTVKQGDFSAKIDSTYVIAVEALKEQLMQNKITLIDSRTADRFAGENETIDTKAGHIPGACNLPWITHLKDGKWATIDQISEHFMPLIDMAKKQNTEIVFYCGSGVTACVNVLALEELGLKAKLYVGSWSDWISYEENPVVKGEE